MYYEVLAREFLQVCLSGSYVKIARELTSTTKPDVFVLLYLKNHNNQAYPKELSNEFHVSTARTAVILNKLEEDGYITRHNDEKDNRQTIVKLSEKGNKLVEYKKNEVVGRLAKMLEFLGPDDAKEYVRLQSKLSQAIKESF